MMDQSHYGISCLYSCYIAALSIITTAIVSKNEEHYNEFRCYEAKIAESEKGWQPPGVEPRTPLA